MLLAAMVFTLPFTNFPPSGKRLVIGNCCGSTVLIILLTTFLSIFSNRSFRIGLINLLLTEISTIPSSEEVCDFFSTILSPSDIVYETRFFAIGNFVTLLRLILYKTSFSLLSNTVCVITLSDLLLYFGTFFSNN